MSLYSISPVRAARLLRSAPMFLAVALAIVLSAYVLAAPSTTFAATTYYVAKNGNNSNPCTAAQPCLTITHGITKLKSGDTLIVKAGTYNENFFGGRFDPPSGSGSAYTTIKAAPGETVWLRPLSFSPDPGIYARILHVKNNTHHVKVERINIDGSGLPQDGKHSVGLLWTGDRTHHLIFDGMEMKHSRGEPIQFRPSSYGNILRNSYIHDVEPSVEGGSTNVSPAGGMYLRGPRLGSVPIPNATLANTPGNLIENNRFENIPSVCIAQRQNEVNNTIHANVFDNCTTAINIGEDSRNTSFYNNLVINMRKACIAIRGATTAAGTKVYNNTFYNNAYERDGCFHEVGSADISSSQAAVVQNNIFYRVNRINGTLPSSNFIGDPKFVNPAQGNFRLQSGSPAIDKGVTLSEVPCDFDGNKRPAGSGYDPGAFEHNGTKDPNCTGGTTGGGTPVFTPGPCNAITSPTAIPTPYGTPYNVLSPQKELLVSVFCEENKTVLTVGNGNQGNQNLNYQGLTYVWHKAYYHPSTGSGQADTWTETTLSCPAPLIANGWCPAKATKDLPAQAAWTVGYTCTWWNGAWKCGCTDGSCSTSFWQIQGINR